MKHTELQKLRKKAGLSQPEAAAHIGMNLDTYRKKEQGRLKILPKDAINFKRLFAN